VISETDRRGLRNAPFCFTEQGMTMLSCVLKSESVIEVNIRNIRTFAKMPEMILTDKDLLLEREEVMKKEAGQDEKNELIFNSLKQFISQKEIPRKKIGY